MSTSKFKIPNTRKEKVELLKRLTDGKVSVKQFLEGILPEKHLILVHDDEGIVCEGKILSEEEAAELISREKKQFSLTVIHIRYESGQPISPLFDADHDVTLNL